MILLNKAKNYIANGAMDFWQRGTSFVSPTQTYAADRWQYTKAGTMAQTVSRDADVPSYAEAGFVFPYSTLLTTTTAQAILAASDQVQYAQKIEGQFLAPVYGKRIVVSFWVKSSITGAFGLGLSSNGGTRGYVATYTVNTANTWEKKTVTLVHDGNGSPWLYTSGIGMYVTFSFAAGTTYQAPTLNAWHNGNAHSHSSCVNLVATNGTTFRITGVQIEEGSEPSNFERMGGHVDNEFKICQRYYEKTYSPDVAPATITNIGVLVAAASWATPVGIGHVFKFATQKRTTPTVVQYNPVTGAIGSFRDVVASDNKASVLEFESLSSIYAQTNAGYTGNVKLIAHYTADAEL
ncbi:hypothetical protein MASR1M48_16270 [Lactococcus petauri]